MAKKRKTVGKRSWTKPEEAAVAIPPQRSDASGRRGLSSPTTRLAIGVLLTCAAAVAAIAFWPRHEGITLSQAVPSAPIAAAQYVGSAKCAACHSEQAGAWKGSDHDLAMQVADEKSVLGNFGTASFTNAGTKSTFFRRDGKYFVNTDGPDGRLADYEIKYTFGVRPLQQYLIEFPGGRMQALGIAWDSRAKSEGGQRWFHLYPGQNIKAGDPLHWTSVSQNWNFQCAECHSTNLRKNFDANSETFRTTWSEINVSCEACHGPGSNHLAWAKKDGDWQALAASKGLELALDERKGVAWAPVAETGNAKRSTLRQSAREIEMCARCHGRASRLSDDYVYGKPPLDTHRLALLEEPLYWNDGQMRDEVYNWGSFVQSRMHAEGVTCSDCHNPHSLKLRAAGNALCGQCHQPAKYDGPTHTHHKDSGAAAACTTCHMPTTTYMVVDPRHDHSLRIPRPDVSAKTGSPNACNNCHVAQSAQWSADAIRKWTGKEPKSYQNFAEALRAGAVGAPGARGALLDLIQDKAQPAIVRASAIALLGHWLTPTMLNPVASMLSDGEPIVRLAAVEALANADSPTRQRYLSRLLHDPVRSIRIEVARALVESREQLAESERGDFDKAIAEYIAVQNYNADRPEGRMNLGNLQAARGNTGAAIAQYRKAIALDPTLAAAYGNLADLYRSHGSESEAEAVLRQGLARNPSAAVLHHVLGLSLVRQGRRPESLRALKQAADLETNAARYAYVYAVALNDSGDTRQALKVLEVALARHPYDRDVLSSLAYYAAQSGSVESAMDYVKQLRRLDPEDAEYVQMEKGMTGRGR